MDKLFSTVMANKHLTHICMLQQLKKKEDMNFKESLGREYMRGFERRKMKGKLYNYIITAKLKTMI